MVRTQIQLPDELDQKLRDLAAEKEWTLAETLRRGAEMLLASYQVRNVRGTRTPLPAVDLGAPKVPETAWRELANMPGDN